MRDYFFKECLNYANKNGLLPKKQSLGPAKLLKPTLEIEIIRYPVGKHVLGTSPSSVTLGLFGV